MRRLIVGLSAWLAACGDNFIPADAPLVMPLFATAPHAPLPQISGHSDTVLAAARLVTLTYQDDQDRDGLEAFGDLIMTSAWYRHVGLEYGVLAGSQVAKVRLGASPATLVRAGAEAQVRQAIVSHLAPGPAGPADPLLYLLYLPAHVARGSDLAIGYHDQLVIDGVPVALAVVVDDPSGLAATTAAAARLLINTATDPYHLPSDGYYADPPMTDPWSLVNGEVADLCQGEAPLPLDDDHPEIEVPRVYSNQAAEAGGSPCKPAIADEPWNNVSAEPLRLQTVARGSTAVFHLTGWSTQPMADWTLHFQRAERSDLSEADLDPELNTSTVNNNKRVTLTVHAPLTADSGQVGGLYVLSGPNAHPWTIGILVR